MRRSQEYTAAKNALTIKNVKKMEQEHLFDSNGSVVNFRGSLDSRMFREELKQGQSRGSLSSRTKGKTPRRLKQLKSGSPRKFDPSEPTISSPNPESQFKPSSGEQK